jgi:hypothetical protein
MFKHLSSFLSTSQETPVSPQEPKKFFFYAVQLRVVHKMSVRLKKLIIKMAENCFLKLLFVDLAHDHNGNM